MLPLILLLIAGLIAPSIGHASHSTVSHVVISEIQIGASVADDEFVELYNPTNCQIDLGDYKLWRKTSSGATQGNLASPLAGTIAAHGYFLIASAEYTGAADFRYTTSSRLATNNTIILYADQTKTIIADKVGMGTATDFEGAAAPNPDAGKSIVRTDGQDTDNNSADFSLLNIPEPQNSQSPAVGAGACTEPPPPPPSPPPVVGGSSIISINEARTRANGQEATVAGAVTAKPGWLSSGSFYIQDETGGLQIYSSQGAFPPLSVGQRVTVSGELSEAFNEKRLKVTSSADIKSGTQGSVSPQARKTGDVDEDDEGELVSVRGEVTETSGDTFYLNDGSGQVKIYIRESTGIDKPRMSQGDSVQVIGIVSQYKEDYRILPRIQDDIALTTLEDENESGGIVPGTGGGTASTSVESDSSEVAGTEDVILTTTRKSLLSSEQPVWVRTVGWTAIVLGGALLLLLPLLLWIKRNGWLPGRLAKLRIFSKHSPGS